jgi:hypothetical protein
MLAHNSTYISSAKIHSLLSQTTPNLLILTRLPPHTKFPHQSPSRTPSEKVKKPRRLPTTLSNPRIERKLDSATGHIIQLTYLACTSPRVLAHAKKPPSQ